MLGDVERHVISDLTLPISLAHSGPNKQVRARPRRRWNSYGWRREGDVIEAYGQRADEYAALFGDSADATAGDREEIAQWAAGVDWLILDVGCGPGQWAAYLAERGRQGRGLDPVAAFVEIARQRYGGAGGVEFDVGGFEDLPAGCCDGILAWYSLIHATPEEVPGLLARCRQALRPGGRLLIGLFDGGEAETPEPIPHAVAPAWAWPTRVMVSELEKVGFAVVKVSSRQEPGARPHAGIQVVRMD